MDSASPDPLDQLIKELKKTHEGSGFHSLNESGHTCHEALPFLIHVRLDPLQVAFAEIGKASLRLQILPDRKFFRVHFEDKTLFVFHFTQGEDLGSEGKRPS